jgi:hypothetical protein
VSILSFSVVDCALRPWGTFRLGLLSFTSLSSLSEAVGSLPSHGWNRQVYHATEVNLVGESMRDVDPVPNTVLEVLPHVALDLVSYRQVYTTQNTRCRKRELVGSKSRHVSQRIVLIPSRSASGLDSREKRSAGFPCSSYDTMGTAPGFGDAINFIRAHHNRTPASPENGFYIGEYGVPERLSTTEWMRNVTTNVVAYALQKGASHIMYWELFNNEVRTVERCFWAFWLKGRCPFWTSSRRAIGLPVQCPDGSADGPWTGDTVSTLM